MKEPLLAQPVESCVRYSQDLWRDVTDSIDMVIPFTFSPMWLGYVLILTPQWWHNPYINMVRLAHSIQTFTLWNKVLIFNHLKTLLVLYTLDLCTHSSSGNVWNHKDEPLKFNKMFNLEKCLLCPFWRSAYVVMQFVLHVCCVTGLCIMWNACVQQIFNIHTLIEYFI